MSTYLEICAVAESVRGWSFENRLVFNFVNNLIGVICRESCRADQASCCEIARVVCCIRIDGRVREIRPTLRKILLALRASVGLL